jgi:hypothetical protein
MQLYFHPPPRASQVLSLSQDLHYLSTKDQDFGDQAKTVALDCIQSQREGMLQDTPLMSALKGRLFGLVGKNDWEICERYLQRYLIYHNIVTEL